MKLVAHRGLAGLYPENSLLAFEKSIEAGADAIECDIQFSKDGTPYLLHDITLERTASHSECIYNLHDTELNNISVHEPQRFAERFKTTPLAPLKSLVALLEKHPQTLLFLEVKAESFEFLTRRAIVEKVVQTIKPVNERVIIISYDTELLDIVREKSHQKIGFVLARYNRRFKKQAKSLKPEYVICNKNKLPKKGRLWYGPWQWFTYDTTNAQEARDLYLRGVSWVESWNVKQLEEELTSKPSNSSIFDVIIVGGGIQGAGIAQVCAAQGWSVLLLEKSDRLAAGTSSKSSKLIHGGLRYLESGQFKLVFESLRERRLLCRIAPTLVKIQEFILPVYKGSTRSPLIIRLGLILYRVLALFDGCSGFRTEKIETVSLTGLLLKGLRKVFIYHDAQTDDAALTRAVCSSAISLGAKVVLNTEVKKIEEEKGGYRVHTARGIYQCKTLVNAAGPWVNRVAATVEPSIATQALSLVKGSHLVLDIPNLKHYFYLEALDDARPVFVLPWKGKLLLGTTEYEYNGDLEKIKPSDEEVDYLLRTYNHYFPNNTVNKSQVLAGFAGCRVLPACSNSLNTKAREMEILRGGKEGRYIAVYGGKLTVYRASAWKVAGLLRANMPKQKSLRSVESIVLKD